MSRSVSRFTASVCTRTAAPSSMSWTRAVFPIEPRTDRTSPTPTPAGLGMVMAVPPVKSRLRLKPRIARLARHSSSATPETMNHLRAWPTNPKEVSARYILARTPIRRLPSQATCPPPPAC